MDLAFLMTMKKTHPKERFAGKTAELALGYQGAVKALMKMAKKMGVDITEEFAWEIVNGWRSNNPLTVQLWYDLQAHAKEAVISRGTLYKTHKIKFRVIGDFLYMGLPSGRRIAYYKPMISPEGDLTYMGIDTYTRRWCRVKTYGGRLTENAASGIARDILLNGLFNLDDAGYPLIGSVHDEGLAEVEHGFGSLEEAANLMCAQPKWTEGLPIVAEGFRAHRYRKD
jgi:DNA polymerase